ncbi:DNA polymerase III subunit epsilon [Vibrio clamense]|uniref:DNA polymerase III subunit epsilon n=1 Tax=Vibrio TaxID=662 RepID=UPI000DEAF524|nr:MULTISPECIES: DNA polymerase III subunit epsilon [Vibrio]MDN3697811.1 DNA polymerase III subunit epsilon [Vibrio cortegadensis]NOH85642.1 DNA polymerase III subunit epsilon [Vibrio sp. 03-59-1]RBW67154.1 DNA polymerase III subunit epsilon [Vibrionales bacterium C3R12]TKF22688.1 DNA polymerase III subunit epsilon [Vibrio genomosp. F6]
MSKLNAEQRKARDDERFSQRVNERREKGEDVVAYALGNKKAVKFLTKSEKKNLKERRAMIQEELKIKEQQELERIEAAFTEDNAE